MSSASSKWAALHREAAAAGQAAAEAVTPTPMVVVERANPWDDSSPVVRRYNVDGGTCGMAWVTVRPGTSGFARWARANAGAYTAYYGGTAIPARPRVNGAMVQSMEINEAYARAYAAVLRDAGIKAYAQSRMD